MMKFRTESSVFFRAGDIGALLHHYKGRNGLASSWGKEGSERGSEKSRGGFSCPGGDKAHR